VAGTLATINAIVAWFRVPETRAVRSAPALRVKTRSVRLWDLAVVGFVAVTAFSGFEATFSLLMGERFDLTESGVAAVFVFVGLTLVASQIALIRPVNGALGVAGSLQAGLALNLVGFFALAVAESWVVLIPALMALTIGQGLVSPNLSTLVAGSVPDERRGEALGFQQGVNAAGRVAGPALAGVLFDHVDIGVDRGAPYIVGALLCGLALTISVPRYGRRDATGCVSGTG
ncbi:MAG: MFS transporter, partial [Actinomycetota bacterium]